MTLSLMTKVLVYDRSASMAHEPRPPRTACAGSMSSRRMLNGVVSRRRSGPISSVAGSAGPAPSARTTADTKAEAKHRATTGLGGRRRAASGASVDGVDMDRLLLVAQAAHHARDVFEPGLRVRLAEGDQVFGVVGDKHQEAQEVGIRGAARPEAAGQEAEGARQTRLVQGGDPAQILRRPDDRQVDRLVAVTLTSRQTAQEIVRALQMQGVLVHDIEEGGIDHLAEDLGRRGIAGGLRRVGRVERPRAAGRYRQDPPGAEMESGRQRRRLADAAISVPMPCQLNSGEKDRQGGRGENVID